MTLAVLLADVLDRLSRTGVPYMVTGSIASSLYGEPRATQDIDIVIDPTSAQLEAIVRELDAGNYYVDAGAARDALRERGQFNAVAPDATKVDLILRHDRDFSRAEFERRRATDLLGTPAFVVTAEDLVIAKLEWAAAAGSDRQLQDVAGIVAIDPELDRAYIQGWAEALGVADTWREISTAES